MAATKVLSSGRTRLPNRPISVCACHGRQAREQAEPEDAYSRPVAERSHGWFLSAVSASVLAARMKSLSLSPPILCVRSVTRTRPQPSSMSG